MSDSKHLPPPTTEETPLATIPNRTEDLSPSGERNRKQRGTSTKAGVSRPARIPEPNGEWCEAARNMWDAMIDSGGAAFYESSDYAVLHLICDQIDHLYQQGGRRSPEYLRVITQTLGTLLATEGDRRKLHIELAQPDNDSEAVLADLEELFRIA